ncbi:RBBP6 [Acanthosepion pharaonis]|uniref:RBBP6 n=1 Tax=Acanthosepion pharaonis TaxID=158019 RepID=A0A812CPK6_ACAPH|nr:RBBP6 [Sepia pharaonis]
MSSVHYKFKSCLQYDTVTFDGLHISLIDLKKAIIQQKKLGKSTEFDLQITNAQSKQRYIYEEDLIPKNASVIVTRVPITEPQRPQPRSWPHYRNDEYRKSPDTQDFAHDRLSQTPDLANADASEDDKIKAMMVQSKFFDPSNFGKGKTQTGTPPVGYVCYKCGKPGHYIYSCSLKGDANMVDMKIKRSTGIPQSFLTLVDSPDHPGALLTQSGHFAVPTIDAIAYKQGKKERPPFLPDPNPVNTVSAPPAPNELLCSLCGELLTDAVVIPCCGNSFCDECVRNALLDSEEHECPSCHELDVSPDKLISNNLLRQAVINYLNQTGYTKMKGEIAQMQQQQQRMQQNQLQMQQKPPNAPQVPMQPAQPQQQQQPAAPPQQQQQPSQPPSQPAPPPQQQATSNVVNNVAVVSPTNPAIPVVNQIPVAGGPSDNRLSPGERPPTPLSDEKAPIHRTDEPQKGMAVPVLGSRNRNIRPLHPVREIPRPVGPPRNRIGERLPPGRNAPSHPHHPIAPAMQRLSQSMPTSQAQPPGSYMQARTSMPPGTMQPGYRIPTPGVPTGPVMPPPSGFCPPPMAPYNTGPRPYPIRTIPTGPRPLTPEEFYREKRRLIEEDKSRSRSNSRSPRKYSRSRSRSLSRSRSRSRTPPYHRSRSPMRRRSRTPPSRSRGRTRSPLAPISSRDPYYRRDWSPNYNRGMRSNPVKRYSPPERPFTRYSHFSPQRPEEFCRFDPHAYEDYYREYFSRYNNPHGSVGTYPAPATVPVATTTTAPQYDRSYYDPRGRPMPPSNASVNVTAANSPSNRSRKGPMARSPLRRDRPREKPDIKTAKLTEPLPSKLKEKKIKVKSEDDLRKKMERKRDEKIERTNKEKAKDPPREGGIQAKKAAKSSEKPPKESKKKSDVKKHKPVEKPTRNVVTDPVSKEDNNHKEPSQNKESVSENVSNVLKRPVETSSSNVDVLSNKVIRPVHVSDPKILGHAADMKTAPRTASAKIKRKTRHQSGDSSQKVSLPLLDDSDKCGPAKKSRREPVHEKTDADTENDQHKIPEKVPRGENDMLLPAPELSKWERDDYEINVEPMKPKKKPAERKPLPRSVIESAEKAITEKRRKPSMMSTSIPTSPKSSLSSRKVYVDEKDNRKLSSVQITIPGGERNGGGSGEKQSRHETSEKRGGHRDSSREHSNREPSAKESSSSHKVQEASKSKQLSDVNTKESRGSDRFERKESMVDEAKFVPDYEESESGSEANTSDVEPAEQTRLSPRRSGATDLSSEEETAKKHSKKSKDSSKKKKHKKHKKHKAKKSKKKKSHKHRGSKEKNVVRDNSVPEQGQVRDGHEKDLRELVDSREYHEHRDSKVRSRIARY